MKNFISMEIAFAFIVLMCIMEEVLIQAHSLRIDEPFSKTFSIPDTKHLKDILNPLFTGKENFFPDYNDDFLRTDSINANEENKIKQIDLNLEELKKYNNRRYEKVNINNMNEVAKNSKKYYPFKNILKPILTRMNSSKDEMIASDSKASKPLEILSEDTPFVQAWPKYSENIFPHVFPFPKIINSKYVDLVPSINEHKTNKKEGMNEKFQHDSGNIGTSFFTATLKENEEIQKPKTAEIFLTKAHPKLSEVSSPKLNHLKEKINQSMTQIKEYQHDSQPTEIIDHWIKINKSQNDNQEYAEAKTFFHQEMMERKSKRQSVISTLESESIDLPWNLHKIDRYAAIMPFPELHNSKTISQNKDTTLDGTQSAIVYKKALPLDEEYRTSEVSGPHLYPKSSFIKEFHVPFFQK